MFLITPQKMIDKRPTVRRGDVMKKPTDGRGGILHDPFELPVCGRMARVGFMGPFLVEAQVRQTTFSLASSFRFSLFMI
jgi:hypothetical protein